MSHCCWLGNNVKNRLGLKQNINLSFFSLLYGTSANISRKPATGASEKYWNTLPIYHTVWERLQSLCLFSQGRRRELYHIIFLWKVAKVLVQGYNATFAQHDRRGRLMVMAPLCNQAPAAGKRARESSLQVKGAKLFNCIPRGLRETFTGIPDNFNAWIDEWISTIPDQPTVPCRQRAAASNSILDQVQLVQTILKK